MLNQKENEAWYKSIREAMEEGRITPAKEVECGTWIVLGALVPTGPGQPLPRWSGEFEAMPLVNQQALLKKRLGDRVQLEGNIWKLVAIFDSWNAMPKRKRKVQK